MKNSRKKLLHKSSKSIPVYVNLKNSKRIKTTSTSIGTEFSSATSFTVNQPVNIPSQPATPFVQISLTKLHFWQKIHFFCLDIFYAKKKNVYFNFVISQRQHLTFPYQ